MDLFGQTYHAVPDLFLLFILFIACLWLCARK
jgi:hypothetical protein